MDPSKTTRVPNVTLKAFQKNAVQSYFERQQQQQKQQEQKSQQSNQQLQRQNQQTFPISKEMLRSNHFNNSTTNNQVNLRPQSLPVNKVHNTLTTTLSPSRSSLPAKLSQMANVTAPLSPLQSSTTKTKTSDTPVLGRSFTVPNELSKSPAPVSLPVKQTVFQKPKYSSVTMSPEKCQPLGSPQKFSPPSINFQSNRIMPVEQSNLQSVNESGVPPPPPRRSKPLMPLRR